jgi:hypothetical protein
VKGVYHKSNIFCISFKSASIHAGKSAQDARGDRRQAGRIRIVDGPDCGGAGRHKDTPQVKFGAK